MLGVLLVGCGDGDTPTTIATSAPAPTTTTTTSPPSKEDLAFTEAEAAFRAYKKLQDELYRDPGNAQLLKQLEGFATGIELDESRRVFKRYAGEDVTVTGHLAVRGVEPVSADLEIDPPTLYLRSCVDATELHAMDESGRSIVPTGHPRMTDNRVMLVQDLNGTWLVARVTNTAVATC